MLNSLIKMAPQVFEETAKFTSTTAPATLGTGRNSHPEW